MRVLIVAAHPDDEVLGCGGTIARRSGSDEVAIAILGEGITSRFDDRRGAPTDALGTLKGDSQAAAATLGVKVVEFGNLPDNRFDELALLDIVKRVESWIGRFRPETIYTHHPGDLNIDHAVTFRAVLTATRPGASISEVSDIFAFEVPSSTEWAFQRISPPFRPNVFIDISATIDRKIAAMQQYSSEAQPSPHPRSPEALRALAEYRGSTAGMKFAEAFELIRSLR